MIQSGNQNVLLNSNHKLENRVKSGFLSQHPELARTSTVEWFLSWLQIHQNCTVWNMEASLISVFFGYLYIFEKWLVNQMKNIKKNV